MTTSGVHLPKCRTLLASCGIIGSARAAAMHAAAPSARPGVGRCRKAMTTAPASHATSRYTLAGRTIIATPTTKLPAARVVPAAPGGGDEPAGRGQHQQGERQTLGQRLRRVDQHEDVDHHPGEREARRRRRTARQGRAEEEAGGEIDDELHLEDRGHEGHAERAGAALDEAQQPGVAVSAQVGRRVLVANRPFAVMSRPICTYCRASHADG